MNSKNKMTAASATKRPLAPQRGDVAIHAFIFWSYDPSSWMAPLTVRITGRRLPDKSDAWSHMGLGFRFECAEDDTVYYEALFSDGFCGPKRIWKLMDFEKTGGRVGIYPIPIYGAAAADLKKLCNAWVGRKGYYAWQLVSMWAFERFGRFLGAHVPRSPERVVCSEAVARLVFPALDLRDDARDFDEVNPNSAWRKWQQIKGDHP